MKAIMSFLTAFFTSLWAYQYFRPFYGLFLGYIGVYLLALALAHALVVLGRQAQPIEKSAYTGWGLAFLVHLICFAIWGLDSLGPSWYGPYAPGYHFTGTQFFWALLRLVPYLLIGIVDVIVAFALLGAGLSRTSAAGARVKRA